MYVEPVVGILLTTNSCGALNKSIEMLLNSTDKNKAIIFMSDGAPTHECDELYSNSRLVEEYGSNATAPNSDFDGETLIAYKKYCQDTLDGYFGVIPYKPEFGYPTTSGGKWVDIIDDTMQIRVILVMMEKNFTVPQVWDIVLFVLMTKE